MKIVREFENYTENTPKVLSLGMFDGVHFGHISIINLLKSVAQENNLETAILTFWPHPRKVFNPNDEIKLLNTLNEKLNLLENANLDVVFLKSFDENFRNLTGEEFIRQILVQKLNVKHIIIGHDHVFGKNKSGNFELLQKLSKELDFVVQQLDAVKEGEFNISSTKIRNCLANGNIIGANKMLGYHYSVSGKVIDGKKLGRTIGYPTANIEVDELKLLPKKGAYIVEVYVKNKFYKGMLSIGTNPTVNGDKLTVEVYILDFNEDIYGEEITVKFRDFLHEEIKFESLEKLIERLDEDKRLTKEFEF
ncbi:MAG: bifunctional riboflavin kinase/FAD synthetase [Cloacibacterium sp.]|nr:bifunctional riboflavin kinase/FAD synthetase [Cloacibacterium sp.]